MPALSYGDYLDVLQTMRKSALKHDRRTTSKGLDAHGNLIFVSTDTTFKLIPPAMLMDLPALRSRLMADRSVAMHRLQTLFCAAATVAALTRRSKQDLLNARDQVSKIDQRLSAVQKELGISTVAGQESVQRCEARVSELTRDLNELKNEQPGKHDEESTKKYIRLNRELLDTSMALAVKRDSEVTDTRYMETRPCQISYKGVTATDIRVHFI